jgi:hypothetical protein
MLLHWTNTSCRNNIKCRACPAFFIVLLSELRFIGFFCFYDRGVRIVGIRIFRIEELWNCRLSGMFFFNREGAKAQSSWRVFPIADKNQDGEFYFNGSAVMLYQSYYYYYFNFPSCPIERESECLML